MRSLSNSFTGRATLGGSWVKPIAGLLLVLIGIQLSGCGGGGDGQADGEKKYRIAVIPKGATHQFWQSVHYGAQQAADELGNVEIEWQSPSVESDTRSQIEMVKNMVTNQVDGIVLAPNHQGSLVDAVLEANDASIPVVIFDSGLDDGAEIVTYVATDNRNGGRMAAKRLAEALGEQGKVILLRYKEGSESTNQREEGFLEEIANYSGIEVVSSNEYGGDSTGSAKEKVQQLLLKHGEATGLFAVCESNANGALEAILEAGKAGEIQFVGFDPSERLEEALKEGHCQGVVLQDPVKMGYESVKAVVAHLKGETVDTYINTGEFIATGDTLDDEEIDRLLHPPTKK